MEKIDAVVQEEIEQTTCNIIRTSARLANERINETYSTSRKRRASQLTQNATEVDQVRPDAEGISVGTKIKREATRLYEQYHSLGCQDKSVVALGLNSILDLSSRTSPQKNILKDEWDSLCAMYHTRFNRDVVFDRKMEEKFSKIEDMSAKDIGKARSLCLKHESKAQGLESDVFSIYSQYLELLEFHSYVFQKDIDITENDITVKIWAPMIERLFRRTVLRAKWGESVGDSSGVTESSGLKVDLRIIKDTLSRRRKEADKANAEVARINPGSIKTTNDRTKLHVESKVVLDKLVEEFPESTKDIAIPGLQISGAKMVLFSLKLSANGVYVAVKEGVAIVPNRASRVKDFREVLKLLYKFKNATLDVANLDLTNDGDSIGSSSNSSNSNQPSSWVRGTWIPPNANNKKTRLPSLPDVLYFSDVNN